MFKPRYYQKDAIQSILKYFRSGCKGHPLVVMPTGSGKTHVLGGLCQEIKRLWPNEKVLILSHVREILEQDYNALKEYLPDELLGLYSAGLGKRQVRQFTVGGIQSVYRVPELFQDHRLIIVDEAHLIPPTGEGRYRTFLSSMDDPRVVGLTATPFRLGLGYLTDGDLFDTIVYEKDIGELINEGYLCNLSTKATEQRMDTRGIKKTGGDYNVKEMSSKLDKNSITQSIVNELIVHRNTRHHWLLFAIDIEHAEHITSKLIANGIMAACVHSKMKVPRKDIIDLFKANGFQALVSVETLTTGFDAPNVDLIGLLRPTTSPVLHVQMIGRGLRVSPHKKDCLVLDFAGNTERLGPINRVKVPIPGIKTGTGTAPVRTCPECQEVQHAPLRVCKSCGYKFPITTKLTTRADSKKVIEYSTINTHKVNNVLYAVHRKPGKITSLKVTYVCGLRMFHEWVTLEHPGFPGHKARYWWKYRASTTPPRTIKEAILRVKELTNPITIDVDEGGKYPVIKRCSF